MGIKNKRNKIIVKFDTFFLFLSSKQFYSFYLINIKINNLRMCK